MNFSLLLFLSFLFAAWYIQCHCQKWINFHMKSSQEIVTIALISIYLRLYVCSLFDVRMYVMCLTITTNFVFFIFSPQIFAARGCWRKKKSFSPPKNTRGFFSFCIWENGRENENAGKTLMFFSTNTQKHPPEFSSI